MIMEKPLGFNKDGKKLAEDDHSDQQVEREWTA